MRRRATGASPSRRSTAPGCSCGANRGLGYLYNEGARAASAAYVFCVNNDVALEPRCLELLAAELDADASRFEADPRQVDWSGERLVHACAPPDTRAAAAAAAARLPPRPVVPAETVVPTLSANGGAMLVRREPAARPRRLRRDDVHGLRGHRPLLARLAPRLAERPRPRRRRPAPGRCRRPRRPCSGAGSSRRTTTCSASRSSACPRGRPSRVVARRAAPPAAASQPHRPGARAAARELPEVRRERQAAAPSGQFTRWVLAGMPGGLPPAARGAPVGAAEEREGSPQEDLQVDER